MASLSFLLCLSFLPLLSFAQQRQLSCSGDIHFSVVTDFQRNDRDYYFHGYVASVQDCVKSCFTSEFCFSAGFQPGQSGNNSCLLSYKSAYGCSFRQLVTSYSDNSKEVVIECVRCPAAGEIITPAPTPQIGILSGANGTSETQAGNNHIETTSASQTSPTTTSQLTAENSTISLSSNASLLTTIINGATTAVSTDVTTVVNAAGSTAGSTAVSAAVTQESTTVGGSTQVGSTVSIAQSIDTTTNATRLENATIESSIDAVPSVAPKDPCKATLTYQVLLPKDTDKSNSDFYSHEKVGGVDACAQLCFRTPGCASVGYIPNDKANGICILAKEKKDQTCLPTATRHTNYEATEPVHIDCIQCGSTVTGAPVIDSSIESQSKVESSTPSIASNVTTSITVAPGESSSAPTSETATNSTAQSQLITSQSPSSSSSSASENSTALPITTELATHNPLPVENVTTSQAQSANSSESATTVPNYNTAGTAPVGTSSPNLPGETTVSGSTQSGETTVTTTAGTQCSGQLNFRVTPVNHANGFVDHVEVRSGQECAKLCHSRPDCDVAGFLPGANGDSTAACFFTKGVSGNCSEEKAGKFDTDYRGDQPVTISCITCGELKIDANVTSFTKESEVERVSTTQSPIANQSSSSGAENATAANIAQNNIETVTIQQSSSNSTVDNATLRHCQGDLKFMAVTPSGDKTKTEYIDDMEVKSAAECAKICYSKPDCQIAGFSPLGPNRHSCILSRNSKAECPTGDAKLLVDYTDSAPMHLQCFTCS